MASPRPSWLLTASDRLYRALLLAYPAAFRREFGPHMAQVFRDCCHQARQEQGLPGLLRLWLATLSDLATSVRVEHRATVAPSTGRSAVSRPRCRERSMTMRLVRRSPRPDPFARFTDRARNVLALAQLEARGFDHTYLGTEHLLLGLVRDEAGVASSVLHKLGVRTADVRRAVEQMIGNGRGQPALCEMCLTPRTKRVLELARDEATRLRHDYIGTEHLLLGLMREGEGVGAGVLERLGVDLERTRALVLRVLGDPRADR
jgi:Clp amino terminal domain, pathogenicity island component